MACEVQNQYQRYEQSSPSILAHHELVLKKLSALSVYMDAQGKGQENNSSNYPNARLDGVRFAAARDWYGEANSPQGQFDCHRSASLPIPPPAFQFSAQSASPPLSTSAPSSNPLSQRCENPSLPRVASFSSGWHREIPKTDKSRESLAASAARFYERKRRASMKAAQSLNAQTLNSSPLSSPLGRSSALFIPRECSQDSLERLGSCRGGSSQDGGFFFAPGDKHRVLSHFTPSPFTPSPTSSLSSVLSGGVSGDSNPVSPNRTDSDGSGHSSSSMEGASKPLPRNWDLEAESALGGGRKEEGEGDRLAPLAGRGLRRGLSRHYGGKSRSFTCLADVVTKPIQDLAKPENPYAKRRKNNNGSHSNLLDRASGGVFGNFPQKPMLADNLGFSGCSLGRDSEMNDVEGGAFEWAEEGGDVATALRPMAQFQPLRSQSMADLRAIGRRRSHPEY